MDEIVTGANLLGVLLIGSMLWGCVSMDTPKGGSASGNTAPDFTLPDQDGNNIALSDAVKSGEGVILAFYPKDDTRN